MTFNLTLTIVPGSTGPPFAITSALDMVYAWENVNMSSANATSDA